MVLDTAANFVRSDVDAQVASGATTVSVVNASPFPDPSTSTPYNCVLWDASLGSPYQDSDVEIVRVTAVDYTNNDLTVTRAQESTADVTHPSTSAIQLSPTAKMMSDVDSSLETIADFTTNEVTADVNNSNVTTTEGEATNETFIQAETNTNFTGLSSGSWTNPFDGESTDVRNEFNSSQQFVPDKTGRYAFVGTIFFGNFADQDQLAVRLYNVTDSVVVGERLGQRGASGSPADTGVVFSSLKPVTAGKAYEIQAVNFNSTFTIKQKSEGFITRNFVQP